jgi:ATP-dependent RNA helicase SUPV3L1/SUV3
MIEIAQMVESADKNGNLSPAEVFGFSCAPVNLGLLEHVQYFVWILNSFVKGGPVNNEEIAYESDEIDYLETSIKCVELYQWLSRHFNNKNFDFDQTDLLENKTKAIEKLNSLLSQKIVPTCNSCGVKLPENTQFAICDTCFRKKRTFNRRPKEDRKGTERRPRRRRR